LQQNVFQWEAAVALVNESIAAFHCVFVDQYMLYCGRPMTGLFFFFLVFFGM
jgi:hypothetical protein